MSCYSYTSDNCATGGSASLAYSYVKSAGGLTTESEFACRVTGLPATTLCRHGEVSGWSKMQAVVAVVIALPHAVCAGNYPYAEALVPPPGDGSSWMSSVPACNTAKAAQQQVSVPWR